MEEWKDIPNYEGYQVSNKGRIRTHNKKTFTNKHGERKWVDKILHYKSNNSKTGYRVDLWKNGKPKTMLVARLVAFTFYNEDINNHNLTVDHIDGNRFNNNLKNLELVSLKENIIRGFDNGLYSCSKKTILTNKKNNNSETFRSMAKASKSMNKNHGYISSKIKQSIFEDEDFKWKVF